MAESMIGMQSMTTLIDQDGIIQRHRVIGILIGANPGLYYFETLEKYQYPNV